MQRGVLLVLVVLAAAIGAVPALADGTAGTTTSTTGTTTAGTTTTAAPSYAPLLGSRLTGSCVGAGAAAIQEPGRAVLALGTPASSLAASAYPVEAPVVSFDAASASGSGCGSAHVILSSVSLFGGTVTASTVQATGGKGRVSGLEIDGTPVSLTRGDVVSVEGWGQLTLGGQVGRLAAPLVLSLLKRHDSLPAGTTVAVAFSAASLPSTKPASARTHSGTSKARTHTQTQRQAAHATKADHRSRKRHHRKRHMPQPLKWTPRLGQSKSPYVFPVDGGASYGDSYGGDRSDIYDGWHHGDDLFAPIGTPVVAVTTGKLSLVGWNELGGWRLWLTDDAGDSFYYAHLAGYSRWILHHPNVKAGQVIGFLGRTGDAFTTTPHLHFEVHPRQLLKLGYDGAVDPTRYLQKWEVVHVPKQEIPQPAKLVAPRGAPAQEAAVVWHELLAARHLLRPKAVSVAVPTLGRLFPEPVTGSASQSSRRIAAVRLAAITGRSGAGSWLTPALLLGALAITLGLVAARRSPWWRRRRA